MEKTHKFQYDDSACACEILIVAAGFEERSMQFLSKTNFGSQTICLLAKFENSIEINNSIYLQFLEIVNSKFQKENILHISIRQGKAQIFERELTDLFSKIPRGVSDVWIDISGMQTFIICSVLKVTRDFFPNRFQTIIYTSAEHYFPTFEEYSSLKAKEPLNIEFLPKSMAMEMSEVLMLETFSGHRSKEGISCLALFAGYDVQRSAGVIESINPSMMILLYGDPGDAGLSWRLNLSKQLHKKFETSRKTAVEVVSTLDIYHSLEILEQYYEFLFEDYDFTIAPICSKMQVVTTYLFWERYKEVQLVFPLPIGYSFERRPRGVGNTYLTKIDARNSLYRAVQKPE